MASPLTNENSKTHKLYQRRAEIDQAVVRNDECLAARAQQHDAKSPDYLHSETLVHLHRRAVRMGKPGDAFMLALVARCEENLKRTTHNRTPQVADEPVLVPDTGMYRYLGGKKWDRIAPSARAKFLHIGF